MKTGLRVGFDMDGVITNFSTAYTELLHRLDSKIPIINNQRDILDWTFNKFLPISREVESKAWDIIRSDDYFWVSLKPLIDLSELIDFITLHKNKIDFYFITSRPNSKNTTATYQTTQWLKFYGVEDPIVIETSQKGLAASLLRLSYYIDDKVENCEDVLQYVPGCKVYSPDYPYNMYNSKKVVRVSSVIDYIKDIKRKENIEDIHE